MAKVKAKGVAVYVYRPAAKSFEFLQLHRSRHTAEYQRSWQIVYGGIEKKERATEAALRELKEETALAPLEMFQVEYLESFYYRPDDHVMIMPVFAARVAADAQVELNEEHDDFRWVGLQDVARHFIWRTQRQAIEIISEDILKPAAAIELLRIDTSGRRAKRKR